MNSQPEPTPEQVAVYDAGVAAFAAGEASTTCPHPAGSDERLLWVNGYVRARRDAGVRAPRLPQEA